jgi:hypothetical protein
MLSLAVPAKAQMSPKKIELGLKAGLGTGRAEDYDGDTESKRSFIVGGVLGYKESRLFTLQIELLFFSKGYKVKNVAERDSLGNIVGQADIELTFSYIEMPVLAKLTPSTAGNYKPYLVAGGYAAYSVDDKLRLLTDLPFIFKVDNVDKFDYGLVTGVGLDMKSGGGNLFIETRYDMGFGKVIKNQDQTLRVLSFHLGYSW